jgi:Ca2+-binding EF-hand superfamily protein
VQAHKNFDTFIKLYLSTISTPNWRDSYEKKILTLAMLLCTTAVLATEVKKADKDADGTLDKNEVKAFKMLSKHFDLIDTDKDGTIDQAEINAHKALMADKDGDSTIDKKEIKHKEIAKKFDELDTDKDGTLDAKEILAFFKKG